MKKVNLYFAIAGLAIFILAACQGSIETKTVSLKGKINGAKGKAKISLVDLKNSFDRNFIDFEVDSNNYFQLQLDIEKPAYFKLGKNEIFLEPGKELWIDCDYRKPENSKFKGELAEINEYIQDLKKNNLGFSYPQTLIKKSQEEAFQDIKREAKEAIDRLVKIKDGSVEFRKLEEARLKTMEARIFISLLQYLKNKTAVKYKETQIETKPDLTNDEECLILKICERLSVLDDESYLDSPDVRFFLALVVKNKLVNSGFLPKDNLVIMDYVETISLIDQIEYKGLLPEFKNKSEELKERIVNQLCIKAIQNCVAEFAALTKGAPMPDISGHSLEGELIRLSDFKGKYVYIDFWATWCGPCKRQIPAFKEQEKKYAGKEIVFLKVSIDKAKAKWENYQKKHTDSGLSILANDVNFKKILKINSIPRFILVDRQGNIYNARAPRPSDPNIEKILDELLAF